MTAHTALPASGSRLSCFLLSFLPQFPFSQEVLLLHLPTLPGRLSRCIGDSTSLVEVFTRNDDVVAYHTTGNPDPVDLDV